MMHYLLRKLCIGEKIGIGFGLVGVLFLAVIWQYHSTLERSLADYQELIEIYDARKDLLFEIQAGMSEARRAEKNFLLHRNEAFATEVSLSAPAEYSAFSFSKRFSGL